MYHLAILGSTRGTNLTALCQAIDRHVLNAKISVVISNKPHSGILDRAKQHSLATEYLPVEQRSREAYDQALHTVLNRYPVELIVMIGYMRIVSPWLVAQWPDKIINIHPSLLPKHKGLMDLAVHQAVLDAKETITGCTTHFVNNEVDGGRIIMQKQVPVFPGDTAEILKKRVQQQEGLCLIETIDRISKNTQFGK